MAHQQMVRSRSVKSSNNLFIDYLYYMGHIPFRFLEW